MENVGGYTYIVVEIILQQLVNFWNLLDNVYVFLDYTMLDCIFAGFVISCACSLLTCFSESEDNND